MTPSKYDTFNSGYDSIQILPNILTKSNKNTMLVLDEKNVHDINQFCIKFIVIAKISYK
jgi:hypothetical protein